MKTKAEQLVEVAKWIKKQNNDFAKNFKAMRCIIKFYLQLPECYGKSDEAHRKLHALGIKDNTELAITEVVE